MQVRVEDGSDVRETVTGKESNEAAREAEERNET